MNVQVVRTDAGAVTHLKVTLTIPPVDPEITAYRKMFFYGWIATPDGKRLGIYQCKESATCPSGFLQKDDDFSPGERVTIELDLPKSFVDADGAHLYLGIGGAGNSAYFPTQNLLVQK